MKRHFCLIVAFFIIASPEPVNSQKLISNSSVTGVCYAGNKTNRIYIPPPDAFFRKSGAKGGGAITVNYSGFPPKAQASVEYAVSILESILPADTKVTISASWEKISTSGVLANSGITGYASGFTIDAQNPHAAYPIALAEKIGEKSLNDSLDSDITLRINNSVDWYLGTDGKTPSLKYDLVTIVLHEVCHGLGFFDSMNAENNIGWYGIDSAPLIYDTFLENTGGNKLTDTLSFQNYSYNLYRELTGGNLYFNGPLLRTYTSGSRARIYVPLKWDSGSSISHLDENQTFEPNTLMTPFIDMGEAIHNPGKFTMSILGDLGWINTRIIHKANHDTEEHLHELMLSVRIKSDTIYKRNTIGAVFSFDNFSSSDTVFMSSPGSDDIFNCTLTIPSYNSEVQYYFLAEDCFNRTYRSPSLPDSLRYRVHIGTDTVKPVMSHTPLTSFLDKIDTIKIIAAVTDNLGVDTVITEYKLNDGPASVIGMKAGKDNNYTAEIVTRSLLLKGGDSIQYRIIATDSARVANSSSLPKSGLFSIHIEGLSGTLQSYYTDFSGDAANDFINDGFDVSKPSGFSSYGLNTKHPYESPEDNDKTIEYTSILRHPLKFGDSGIVISFNEVVLVEPGEPGSLFGSEGFYDYVIVEGSGNFGKKWTRLADGWDSRFYSPWETTYNSSIDGFNSTALGNESMLHKRSIYYSPSVNIPGGDTLLIRFRLFSDPFANGWGWIIEDLKIGPLVDDVEKIPTGEPLKAYPNPGHGLIRINSDPDGLGTGKSIRYEVFSTSGICVRSGYLTDGPESEIDISDRPVGIYIIVLYSNNNVKTIKYSLIR